MAAVDRLSFLPTIKCSSCGVDIEISQLADHVCAPSTPTDGLYPPKLDRAATFDGASSHTRPEGPTRTGRVPPPPKIDPYAANKPFYPQDLSPASGYNDTKGRSALSPGLGRPFPMNRSATSPVPRTKGPPSPDFSHNMDSAFPLFPTNRSGTPVGAKAKPTERPEPAYDQLYVQPSPLFAPLSPRTNGGESVVRRMDTIAPGPFDGRMGDSRPSTSNGPRTPGQSAPQFNHKRTNTQGSVRSNGNGLNQRISVASTLSRGSMFSTGSVGLPSRPKLGAGVFAAMPPPPPPPPKDEKAEGIDAFLARLQRETMGPSKITQDSHTKATDMKTETQGTSEASRLEDNDYSKPSNKDNAATYSQDSDTLTSRTYNPTGSSAPFRDSDIPSVPSYGREFPVDTIHTPSDSGLSEDSYASSGFRSAASSRSSPPSSEAGHSRQASRIGRSDYLTDEPIRRTNSPEMFLDPIPVTRPLENRQANGNMRGERIQETTLQPPRPLYTTPESPIDPAIQRGLLHERRRQEAQLFRDPALNLAVSPPAIPESDTPPEMRRRPTAPSKGKCRGCGEQIFGKSVKDSSGRLTGRYHKQCFVCRTCCDPFPTAEFYVFENSPYCEQHYHQLNGSLCTSCNRGIEGQYLETDQRLKFHPRCFACSTCRIILRDDYYEVSGRNYCERHAYSAMNQHNNFLGPGNTKSRNLQKRRTRLMMMA